MECSKKLILVDLYHTFAGPNGIKQYPPLDIQHDGDASRCEKSDKKGNERGWNAGGYRAREDYDGVAPDLEGNGFGKFRKRVCDMTGNRT